MKRPSSKEQKGKKVKQESESDTDLSDVEMSFELFNMDIPDFHAVRLLLQQAFRKVEVGSLAELITEHLSEYIGTCVKQSAEDDALGFVTLIPCKSAKSLHSFLGKYFDLKDCGLLLMERMMNMPAELAKPMYQQLLDDYREAMEEDSSFKVKRVIIYTPIYWEVESELEGKKKPAEKGPFYYQEEIEPLMTGDVIDISMHADDYTADSKRAFSDLGIKPGRRMTMVTWQDLCHFIENL